VAGARFAAAASALDVRITYHDPTRAIRSLLRESSDGMGTVSIVLSLVSGNLFGRRVFDREAVQWAIANVPE
jgi:hypothetical protein